MVFLQCHYVLRHLSGISESKHILWLDKTLAFNISYIYTDVNIWIHLCIHRNMYLHMYIHLLPEITSETGFQAEKAGYLSTKTPAIWTTFAAFA